MLTLETLQGRHRFILGSEPDEVALALYRRYPTARGYTTEFNKSKPQQDETAQLRAVLVVTLAQAFEEESARVVVCVPKACAAQTLHQCRAVATLMYDKLRERAMGPEKFETVSTLYKRVFNQMAIVHHPPRRPPTHWASFGYLDLDPTLPVWLRDGLV